MKKTITILLLTALCMTVFASCDLGNGLVAELLGEINQEHVLVDPPLQNWEDEVTLSTSPVDIVPPMNPSIDTFVEETTAEYWSEDETFVDEWTEQDTTEIYWETEVPPIDPMPSLQGVLTMDGDLSDWHANGWINYWWAHYDRDTLDAWVGELSEDDGFTMLVTCDLEYVYLAFDVNDNTIRYSENGTYNGDAFQIQLDLGGLCGQAGVFERGVFYSFGLQEDGSAHVTVQCIASDAAASVDYVMSTQDDAEGGLMGATVVREDGSGWIAEIAIPWMVLLNDITAKLGLENMNDLRIDSDNIKAVMLVCYLNQDPDGMITGAWGTANEKGALINGEGWYPENGGIRLWFDPGDLRVECYDIELGYEFDITD